MKTTIFSGLQSVGVHGLWKFVGDGKLKLFFSLSQTKDKLDKTTAIATLSIASFYVVHAVQVCEMMSGRTEYAQQFFSECSLDAI